MPALNVAATGAPWRTRYGSLVGRHWRMRAFPPCQPLRNGGTGLFPSRFSEVEIQPAMEDADGSEPCWQEGGDPGGRREKGGTVKVDRTLDGARPDSHDAIVLPGGVANPGERRRRKPDDLSAFCKKMVEEFREGRHMRRQAAKQRSVVALASRESIPAYSYHRRPTAVYAANLHHTDRKPKGGTAMSIVRSIEVIAQSTKSFDDACRQAVKDASETVRGIRSFWIKNAECIVEDDEITMFRVNGKLSFMVEREQAEERGSKAKTERATAGDKPRR